MPIFEEMHKKNISQNAVWGTSDWFLLSRAEGGGFDTQSNHINTQHFDVCNPSYLITNINTKRKANKKYITPVGHLAT